MALRNPRPLGWPSLPSEPARTHESLCDDAGLGLHESTRY